MMSQPGVIHRPSSQHGHRGHYLFVNSTIPRLGMTKSHGTKDLTPHPLSRICELHAVNGWGPSRTRKGHPEVKRDTIKKTPKKAKSRDNNQSSPRTGRTPILTHKDRKRIVETLNKRPDISNEELLTVVDNRCGKTTLWRLFQELGIRKQK